LQQLGDCAFEHTDWKALLFQHQWEWLRNEYLLNVNHLNR
jgi:hypothetical protein